VAKKKKKKKEKREKKKGGDEIGQRKKKKRNIIIYHTYTTRVLMNDIYIYTFANGMTPPSANIPMSAVGPLITYNIMDTAII
jgi:hypothetical protein